MSKGIVTDKTFCRYRFDLGKQQGVEFLKQRLSTCLLLANGTMLPPHTHQKSFYHFRQQYMGVFVDAHGHQHLLKFSNDGTLKTHSSGLSGQHFVDADN